MRLRAEVKGEYRKNIKYIVLFNVKLTPSRHQFCGFSPRQAYLHHDVCSIFINTGNFNR